MCGRSGGAGLGGDRKIGEGRAARAAAFGLQDESGDRKELGGEEASRTEPFAVWDAVGAVNTAGGDAEE